MVELDDFLEHHGVKGMHWGIRNKRKSISKKEMRARAKRRKLSDHRRQISDSDLKTYIERLNNEKKLKQLVEEDLNPGKSAAKRILSESGQKIARTVIAGAGIVAVKYAIERKMTPKNVKVKLDPRSTADTISRGGLKKG